MLPSSLPYVDRAILVARIESANAPHHLGPVISSITARTRSRLVILIISDYFNSIDNEKHPGISHTEKWDDVQRLLTYVYVQATKVAQDMDNVLMDVDVLLKGTDEEIPDEIGLGLDVLYRVAGDIQLPAKLPQSIVSLQQIWLPPGGSAFELDKLSPVVASHLAVESLPNFYPVVALGGTFDHLHAGHKILLSMSAWIASKKVIVGVTDDKLLKNKSNKEVLEDLPLRMDRVRGFLTLFKPDLIYDIVPISDVYGPTGWDPNIQALIVSKETLAGAASIDKHRKEKSLPALRTFVIDVISSSESSLDDQDAELLKQTKMSSTFIREWIVRSRRDQKSVGG